MEIFEIYNFSKIDLYLWMAVQLRGRENELRHFEVESNSWFYMNHMAPQGTEVAHDHNYLEIVFVMRGKACHTTLQGQSVCRQGEVYLIPRGSWHGYSHCEGLELFNCLLAPALLENELGWLRREQPFGELSCWADNLEGTDIECLRLPPDELPRLCKRLEVLLATFIDGESRLAVLGQLLLVLDVLQCAMPTTEKSRLGPVLRHPSVQAGLTLLHREYTRDWTLESLAESLNLNPSYLVRLFRSQVGLPPMKYLANVRAHRAATLLMTTDCRIGEIGERVGWPEAKLFSRQFQQHFGMSASVYRRRMLRPFAASEL